MPVDDPVFGKRLVKMAEDLDEGTLQEISRITSAKYFRVTSRKRFKEIYDEIDTMEKTKVEIKSIEHYEDFYQPFLIASFIFLCMEIFLKSTLLRTVP